MAPYIPRLVDGLLTELLAELPAVMVTGPRAAGKTTTVARHAASLVRLDRPAEAAAFDPDPDAALAGFDEPVARRRPRSASRTLPAHGVRAGGPRGGDLARDRPRHPGGHVGAERVIGVEVEATAAPDERSAAHLTWLRDRLGDRFVAGVVLHTGPATFRLGDRIVAAPISTLRA